MELTSILESDSRFREYDCPLILKAIFRVARLRGHTVWYTRTYDGVSIKVLYNERENTVEFLSNPDIKALLSQVEKADS